jgi:hypothetical protein
MVLPVSCDTVSIMQIGSAGCAAAAAILWLRASLVKMPSTDFDTMPINDLGLISRSFGRQGFWNALAAMCAAAAAALQALLVYAPSCIALQ